MSLECARAKARRLSIKGLLALRAAIQAVGGTKMLKPGRKTATRSRTVDRYYAKLLATGQQQRKAARRHSKKDQKQEQIAAVALAYVKNEELKLAAAVVAMPPPPSFHDPYGYDITDAPAPKRCDYL